MDEMMTRFWSGVNGMIERGAIGGGALPVGVNGGYSLAPYKNTSHPLGWPAMKLKRRSEI